MGNEPIQQDEISNTDFPIKTEWDFSKHQECLNEIGKLCPRQFLMDASDLAFDIVVNWLRESNAPQEIIDIMDDGYVLEILTRTYPGQKPYEELDFSEVPLMLSRIFKMVYKNGNYIEAGKMIIREDSSVEESS